MAGRQRCEPCATVGFVRMTVWPWSWVLFHLSSGVSQNCVVIAEQAVALLQAVPFGVEHEILLQTESSAGLGPVR